MGCISSFRSNVFQNCVYRSCLCTYECPCRFRLHSLRRESSLRYPPVCLPLPGRYRRTSRYSTQTTNTVTIISIQSFSDRQHQPEYVTAPSPGHRRRRYIAIYLAFQRTHDPCLFPFLLLIASRSMFSSKFIDRPLSFFSSVVGSTTTASANSSPLRLDARLHISLD